MKKAIVVLGLLFISSIVYAKSLKCVCYEGQKLVNSYDRIELVEEKDPVRFAKGEGLSSLKFSTRQLKLVVRAILNEGNPLIRLETYDVIYKTYHWISVKGTKLEYDAQFPNADDNVELSCGVVK